MLTHQTIRTALERSFNQRYGAGQGVTIDHPFDQVVLGPVPHGLKRQLFVPEACQHDDGYLWGLGPGRKKGVKPLALWQS